jgi:general stress protein 26
MEFIEVESFADIEAEFIERVHRVVWCSAATVDTKNRPRSRVWHTIWEGQVGWIATRRHTLKTKHLANNPYVSLGYVSDVWKPVYVDCHVEWADNLADKERIWNLFKNAPAPVGYDPTPIFINPDHENFGILKLTPWRIEMATVPTDRKVWHSR